MLFLPFSWIIILRVQSSFLADTAQWKIVGIPSPKGMLQANVAQKVEFHPEKQWKLMERNLHNVARWIATETVYFPRYRNRGHRTWTCVKPLPVSLLTFRLVLSYISVARALSSAALSRANLVSLYLSSSCVDTSWCLRYSSSASCTQQNN